MHGRKMLQNIISGLHNLIELPLDIETFKNHKHWLFL